MQFETENDLKSQPLISPPKWRAARRCEALQRAVRDSDGFFTFVVGTKNGVLARCAIRIACKPAVMAETDQGPSARNTGRWSTCRALPVPASGSPSPPPSISGSIEMPVIDLIENPAAGTEFPVYYLYALRQ